MAKNKEDRDDKKPPQGHNEDLSPTLSDEEYEAFSDAFNEPLADWDKQKDAAKVTQPPPK